MPEHRIETIELGTGTYTFDQLASYIRAAPGYLGDVSMGAITSEGMLPSGITSSDEQAMLNHIIARENELVQLFHETETPQPPPSVEPAPAPTYHVPGFNAGFYLANNSDVASNGIDPLVHFALYGDDEGRDLLIL